MFGKETDILKKNFILGTNPKAAGLLFIFTHLVHKGRPKDHMFHLGCKHKTYIIYRDKKLKSIHQIKQ